MAFPNLCFIFSELHRSPSIYFIHFLIKVHSMIDTRAIRSPEIDTPSLASRHYINNIIKKPDILDFSGFSFFFLVFKIVILNINVQGTSIALSLYSLNHAE